MHYSLNLLAKAPPQSSNLFIKRRNGENAVNHMRRESNIGNIILPAQRLSNTAGFIPCFHADSPTSLVFERDNDIR